MIATRQAKTLRVVVLQNAESLQSQADRGGVLIAVALKVNQPCDLAHPCSTSMGAAVSCWLSHAMQHAHIHTTYHHSLRTGDMSPFHGLEVVAQIVQPG